MDAGTVLCGERVRVITAERQVDNRVSEEEF